MPCGLIFSPCGFSHCCRCDGFASRPPVAERNCSAYFRARQLRGSFLRFDAWANRYTAHTAARCRQGFIAGRRLITEQIPAKLGGPKSSHRRAA